MNKVVIGYDEGVSKNRNAERVVKKAVLATLRHFSVPHSVLVSVVLTDNAHIHVLNRTARGVDSPTDVLSFPMLEYRVPGVVEAQGTDFEGKYLLLGDIVISLERASEQAEEYGHSQKREVGFLTVHSMLHLFGFDHMEEAEGDVMRAKEKEILNEMRLWRE